MGLISAVVTATTAPQGYNKINITLFPTLFKFVFQEFLNFFSSSKFFRNDKAGR
jgi:hypothetical protein